jgi:hypothetical protein
MKDLTYKEKVLKEVHEKFSPGYIGWATPISLQKEFADFISQALDGQLEAQKVNIGMLRQWLNEDRIKTADNFVTNEELAHWLYWNIPNPSQHE